MTRFILLILTCLFAQLTLAATDCRVENCRYVRSGASGSGADWNDALGSLPSTLTRGTVYFIADGSYSGRTFNTPVSGSTLITIKKATQSDHGTDTGWTSTYGDGQAAFTSGFNFTTSYWLIDGQTGGGAVNNWGGTYGFKITETGDGNPIIKVGQSSTADNVTIRHVDLQGKGSVSNSGGSISNDAVAVYGDNNFTISYYHMKGVGRCPFFISPRNFVAEHGWVESYNGSSAVHSEVASIWAFDGSVGDTTFRYNLITDIRSTGGLMWDNSSNTSARLLVYGNVFYKPSGASWEKANGVVGGWTGGGGEQFHNAKVYNNSFVNIDQESLSGFPQKFSNNEAYNNIFYNSQAPNFAKFAAHDYNLFINSGTTQGEANGKTASANPFVDIAGKNFRLTAATAAGKSFAAPFNVDPLGVTRGSNGNWDRGAFQFGGTAAATPTPAPIATPPPTTPVPTAAPTSTPVPTAAPAPAGGETLLDNSTPASVDNNDGTSYELGMKFIPNVAGRITAIRFYKSPKETGSHTGKIYSSSGTLLASVAFTGETASGWQQQNLATPLALTAGSTYVVTVNTGANYYVSTTSGLATQKTSANLKTVVGSNGVFGPVGSLPTQSWNNSNYFRDVVFTAGTATTSPTPAATATPRPTATPTATATPSKTDLAAPKVTITTPGNNTIVGVGTDIDYLVTATDDVAVTKVEFYVDGKLLSTDTTAPYTAHWLVPSPKGVSHTLVAKAYDAAGKVGTSPTVTVNAR